MKLAHVILVLALLIISAIPVVSAQSIQGSPEVYAFSTHQGSRQALFVEPNQSGMDMFSNWTIVISGQGDYQIVQNGSILVKGYSASSVEIHEVFNASKVSVSVYLSGVRYSFSNISIVDFLSSKSIVTVSVSSYMPHQSQFLTVQPGQEHTLMYEDWVAYFTTTRNESYVISVNGKNVTSGTVIGSKQVDFNVSKGGASVVIKIAGKSYDYPQELIASVPLQQYYGHTAPKAQFTLSQYIDFGIHILTDASIALLFAILAVGSWVISRKNRRVMQMR